MTEPTHITVTIEEDRHRHILRITDSHGHTFQRFREGGSVSHNGAWYANMTQADVNEVALKVRGEATWQDIAKSFCRNLVGLSAVYHFDHDLLGELCPEAERASVEAENVQVRR